MFGFLRLRQDSLFSAELLSSIGHGALLLCREAYRSVLARYFISLPITRVQIYHRTLLLGAA
jgi:hypothetical protein